MTDVRPDWKPEKRQKATPKQWAILRFNLNRHCLICGDPSRSAHHLIKRSQGGDDRAENLVGLCGDGTRGCHGLVEGRRPFALSSLRRSLTDAQMAYVLQKKGVGWLDRAYPLLCPVCDGYGCEFCPPVEQTA